MNHETFTQLVTDTMKSTGDLLVSKGAEYAGDVDRLSNFKRGANLTGCTPLQVAFIYLSKHYDSLATYVQNDAAGLTLATSEPIEGRLDDLINYCLLLKALIVESADEAKPSLLAKVETEVKTEVKKVETFLGLPPQQKALAEATNAQQGLGTTPVLVAPAQQPL